MGSVYTDVTKIYQCLLNLLSNASKFTESGEITLEVSRFRRKQEEERGKEKEKFNFIGAEAVASDVLGLEAKREGGKKDKNYNRIFRRVKNGLVSKSAILEVG